MSKESVESVIGKAMLDTEFRELLLSDPDQALSVFDLTDAEKVALKSMDAETMDALANTLDARVSKRAGVW